MTDPLIDVRGVTRRFGPVTALDDVSLEVHAGELVGVLGPNGAGKSTLLSLLTGQRRPDAGTVRLGGGDPREARTRAVLGSTPQETGLPPTLKVREVVDFVAAHYADPLPAGELLERFGLVGLAGRQTGSLSGGQKRRLAVALALVGRPEVILLDEPTTGLDVSARHELWTAIRDFHGGGGTVLLTSHYLEEVQALAERVVVIDSGRVVADDTMGGILASVGQHRITLRSPDDAAAHLPGVTRSERDGERLAVFTSDADAYVRELVTSGTAFSGLEIRGATLEEAFGRAVADAAAPDAAAEPGTDAGRDVPELTTEGSR